MGVKATGCWLKCSLHVWFVWIYAWMNDGGTEWVDRNHTRREERIKEVCGTTTVLSELKWQLVSTTDSGYEWRVTTTTFLLKPHSTTLTFMYLSVNALTYHMNIQVTVCYKNIKKTNEQELDKYKFWHRMENCEYCINRSCSSLYQCFINILNLD